MSAPRPVLVPVGTGAAYARPGEAQSGYLVRVGERALMLDMGAGVLNRLQSELPPERLEAIVVSHLHPDHCADLFALRVYMAFGPGAGESIRVLGPPGLRERLVGFAGADAWEALRFEALEGPEGSVDLGGGLLLRYAEVPHLPPTFALRVESGGGALCYGADCGPNPALPRLARGCDVLLCECSFGARPAIEGVPHLGAPDAAAIASEAGAGRLLLTHCFPEHDREAALSAARAAFAGPVDWARPGEAIPA